jgi:Dolichyl-phosphate-mannose-protein mannosyltransferase
MGGSGGDSNPGRAGRVLLTGFIDSILACLLALIWNAIVLARIRASFPHPEAKFLARTYALTLVLRYGLALFLNAYSVDYTFTQTFWGDSSTYDAFGYIIAQIWSGDGAIGPMIGAMHSFAYVVGAIYFIFGRNQLLVQFINGTMGALSVIVIYAIARELFDTRVARWAALFMAFFPQMIFWSAAIYKDPAIILSIGVCMYSLLKLRRSFTPGYLVAFLCSLIALMFLRFYIFYFVAFATIGTFLFSQKRRALASLATQGVLAIAFVGAFSIVADREVVNQHTQYFELERVQLSRTDLARSARSGFAAEADVSTPLGALSVLPTGLLYLMFAPFPWAVSGVRQILTVPETLVWYALMPALVRGMWHTLRHKLRDALPILVYAASLTLAYAIFQGNVGTAYRQRTQISMFYFIFIGVGLVEGKRARTVGVPQAYPVRTSTQGVH